MYICFVQEFFFACHFLFLLVLNFKKAQLTPWLILSKVNWFYVFTHYSYLGLIASYLQLDI